jgi:hypothetical protein
MISISDPGYKAFLIDYRQFPRKTRVRSTLPEISMSDLIEKVPLLVFEKIIERTLASQDYFLMHKMSGSKSENVPHSLLQSFLVEGLICRFILPH